MRIFLTGGTGFIGSHVAARLLSRGHELVVLARSQTKSPFLSAHERVRRVAGTLADHAHFRSWLEGCDACVHVALGWGDTPRAMLENDTAATVALLDACVDAKVAQFVYTSSTAVLGSYWPGMSEADVPRPSDYYGATKAASESYVLAVGAQTAVRCNVIRPGYTFGNPAAPGCPTQPDQRFRVLVERALAGEPLIVSAGDGTQFLAASDLARVYEAVLESSRSREVYFALGRDFVTWQTIAEEIVLRTGSSSVLEVQGPGSAPCVFDLGKLRAHFGLEFPNAAALTDHLDYLARECRQ